MKAVKRQRRRQSGKLAYVNDADGNPDLSQPIMEEVTEPNLEVRIARSMRLNGSHKIASETMFKLWRSCARTLEITYGQRGAKTAAVEKLRSVDVTSESHSWLAMEHVRKADSFFASWTDIGDDPDETGEVESWTNTLSNPRADIQAIVDVVCRRSRKQKEIERCG